MNNEDAEPDLRDTLISNCSHQTEEVVEEEEKTILTLKVEKGVNLGNLIAIGLIFTGAIMGIAFVNADLVFLLRSNKYFAIPSDKEVGVIQSEIVLASLIATTLLSFFMGQAYDITGRKKIIGVNFIILAILAATIPYTSPSIFWLGVSRVGLGIFSHFLISNPLILDYVKEPSRGRAVVL